MLATSTKRWAKIGEIGGRETANHGAKALFGVNLVLAIEGKRQE
jgi:hypothetical protein